jgi:hypothetical protein
MLPLERGATIGWSTTRLDSFGSLAVMHIEGGEALFHVDSRLASGEGARGGAG